MNPSLVRYSVYRKVLIREDIVLLLSVVIQYKTNQLSRLAGASNSHQLQQEPEQTKLAQYKSKGQHGGVFFKKIYRLHHHASNNIISHKPSIYVDGSNVQKYNLTFFIRYKFYFPSLFYVRRIKKLNFSYLYSYKKCNKIIYILKLVQKFCNLQY